MKKINKKYAILFLLLYIFGLFILKNVNSNFDENLEQTILKRNIIEYSELFRIDRITNHYKKQGVIPISLDSEKDHGIAPYYAFTPFFSLNRLSAGYLSYAWHIYTYTIFFIGFVFLFKLLSYLFKNNKVSLITSLLYFFSPRILIDSFNNNKDIVFMSLIIIMIYFASKFIKEKNTKNAVLFAIIGAFVCNVKILGIFFFGIFGLLYIFNLIYKKEFNKKNFKLGILSLTLCLLLYLLLTPAMWGSGINIIGFFKYCLNNATNFRGEISVLFEGKYWGGSNPPIPWYYLPKLMIITLPIIYSILFISSLIILLKDIIKKRVNFSSFILLGVLICFMVPFLICVIKHPNIYNGWRHFYFLYGLMFIIIGYIINKLKDNFFLLSIICIALIINFITIIRYNVRNTAYYNILVNRKNLTGYYELDYYNTTGKDSLSRFLKTKKLKYNSNKKIYLYGNGFNRIVIQDILINNPKFKKYVDIVYYDELKEKIENNEPVYEMSNVVYSELENYNKRKVYSYKIYKSNITNFYLIGGVKNE